MTTLTHDIRDTLTQFNIQGSTVTPPARELDKSLYAQAKRVLTNIGGKWTRGAFKFNYEPETVIQTIIDTGIQPEKNPTAFFPTSNDVIDMTFDLIDSGFKGRLIAHTEMCMEEPELYQPYRILEPSGGSAQTLDRLNTLHGNHILDTCELLPLNQAIITEKGYNLVGEDFLQYNTDADIRYDFILMNPPFSAKGDPNAYVTHLKHAYSMLKHGGALVCVVPASYNQGDSTAARELWDFFALNGLTEFEPLPQNSFKAAGTTISTAVIRMEKISCFEPTAFYFDRLHLMIQQDADYVSTLNILTNQYNEDKARAFITRVINDCRAQNILIPYSLTDTFIAQTFGQTLFDDDGQGNLFAA